MSQIVNALEEHQFERKLTPSSPILTGLACAAEHSPKFPSAWKKLLRRGPKGWAKLARLVAAESPVYSALVGTTIAVDVVNGGVKVNALPELVTAAVNFRIDFSESIASTQEHVSKVVGAIAKKHRLELSAWKGANSTDLGGRYVQLETFGKPLEPAPQSPSSGDVWELFAGTVRAVIPGPDGAGRIVTPFASTGNTDCKMYYNLTRNVYRFNGAPLSAAYNIHTVDERFRIDAQWSIVDWVHGIIQNSNSFTGEEGKFH
jgi:Gly-Xaa carboxypeptidase